jgi:hypothetical protein
VITPIQIKWNLPSGRASNSHIPRTVQIHDMDAQTPLLLSELPTRLIGKACSRLSKRWAESEGGSGDIELSLAAPSVVPSADVTPLLHTSRLTPHCGPSEKRCSVTRLGDDWRCAYAAYGEGSLCSAERMPINVPWMPYAFSCFNHTSMLPALIEILTSNNV